MLRPSEKFALLCLGAAVVLCIGAIVVAGTWTASSVAIAIMGA